MTIEHQSNILRARSLNLPSWPLLIGFLALAIPTVLTLADHEWSRESGTQGPIVLATGAWLLWRNLPDFKRSATPGSLWLTVSILFMSLISYVFGRAFDLITLEAAGLFGVGLSMVHSEFGTRALLRNWFPFFYLGFAIPLPEYVITTLTASLKQFVSIAATDIVRLFDLPVAHEGVVIYIAQYQLLVEDACSGMNSIIGLLAIGLFYIYLVRGSSVRYALFLAALTIPIAIAANIVRVIAIILITYFFGDDVAQGFLHFAAGMFLFVTALLLIFSLDALIFYAIRKLRRPA